MSAHTPRPLMKCPCNPLMDHFCHGLPDTAARALLEALEALTDPEGHIWHGGNDKCTGECNAARAAIAAARGNNL